MFNIYDQISPLEKYNLDAKIPSTLRFKGVLPEQCRGFQKHASGFAGPCAGHPGPTSSNGRRVPVHLPGAETRDLMI